MKRQALAAGFVAVVSAVLGHAPAAAPRAQSAAPARATSVPNSAPPATQRALIDQYCVTCHNDRLKTAQLSLEHLDLAAVGDHAELWERVVRKLRAGVMPPPDVKRPP